MAGWDNNYSNPEYWNTRTPLLIGMPRLYHIYQDLSDNKIRKSLSKLKGRVLDAGCGDGRFIVYADVGVDFSRGMLNRAKKRYPERDFICASILNLPFKSEVFSSAFSVEVLQHIHPNNRQLAISDLRRVATNSYVIWKDDRSYSGKIVGFFAMHFHFKPLWAVLPYLALFFSFIADRFKDIHKRDMDCRELCITEEWNLRL